MPKINSIATALPEHKFRQDEIRRYVTEYFRGSGLDVGKYLPVFENAQIDERYSAVPLEWFGTERSFQEKNDKYIKSSCELGVKSAEAALENAGLKPQDIDSIIYISTTGLATPSVDARLINLLGLKSNIRRIPVWGLGCAGGAASLIHAFDYLKGYPKHNVLIVAVELCGLTFQQKDFSRSNFVATALFGDGAASVVVSGDDVENSGPHIIAAQSTIWPDSLDIMGWNIVSEGMQVVFSRRIPGIVKKYMAENLQEFLRGHGMNLQDIKHIIAHPGGAKVIEAYEQALNLTNGKMDISREVLRKYGNMSSVTVLFVLNEFLQKRIAEPNDLGIITALGPGFSSESLLVKF
jgi:alkylresorcinol/alkylpyrone synthase